MRILSARTDLIRAVRRLSGGENKPMGHGLNMNIRGIWKNKGDTKLHLWTVIVCFLVAFFSSGAWSMVLNFIE
jgi:hypothetical protein